MSDERRFRLAVTVTAYGPATGEDAASALRDYRETFAAPGGGEVEITGADVIAGMTPDGRSWAGWRLTLNCGHHALTDLEDRVIGKLVTCDLCPLNTHDESSPGRPVRAVRLIADRQPVTAPAEPEPFGPQYWYGTSAPT